ISRETTSVKTESVFRVDQVSGILNLLAEDRRVFHAASSLAIGLCFRILPDQRGRVLSRPAHSSGLLDSRPAVPDEVTMRLIAVLGSALFLVIAPGTILGLGPWWITRWRFESPAWEALPLRVVGAVLILAGVPILLESFARFALEGLGTPAPVAPPRHLVVTGVYRHVRNPIYVALTSIIVGQALLFGNVVLFGYAAIWVFVFNLAVLVHEEPELRATFGAEYEAYCANVP